MADTLMKLGSFRFSVNTITYQTLKRSQAFRWSSQARIQRRPAQQFVGPGEEKMDFTGVVYPQNARERNALSTLRELALLGEPVLLTDGAGLIWGQWVIVNVEESQSVFIANGVPRKQTFQLQLAHYGEDE